MICRRRLRHDQNFGRNCWLIPGNRSPIFSSVDTTEPHFVDKPQKVSFVRLHRFSPESSKKAFEMERPSLLLSQTAPLAEKGNDGRFFLLLLIQTNLHQSLNFFHQDFFSDSNVDFFRPQNLKTVEFFFANVERNSWVFSFSYKKIISSLCPYW